jgi:hypothetical protein
MAGFRILDLILDPQSADPGSPVDGQSWYNSTDNRRKIRENGATKNVGYKEELDTHEADNTNPHSATLEQVRTAGNTLAGDIDASGFKILNLGGTANTDAASRQFVIDQVNQKVQGLDWQDSVLDKDLVTAPGSPGTGDRYIIAGIGGAWSGFTIGDIVEWNGTSWDNSTPNEGFATHVEDEDLVYLWISSWVPFGSAIDHGNLVGLTDIADHPGFLDLGGTRPMTGTFDTDGNDITTGVGTVNGVTVEGHASRHAPDDADGLTTAAPTQGIGGGNSAGTDNSFSRSDHDHTVRTGATDLTVGAIADGEFVKRSGTALIGGSPSGLTQKSGRELAAGFSGNPKTATITFSGAMPSTNYHVQLTPEGNGGFAPYVENKTTGGFDINMNANNITGLVLTGWLATLDGET